MKNLLASFIVILFPLVGLHAQQNTERRDSFNLQVYKVLDGFYEKAVNARITVYEQDSTTVVLDSMKAMRYNGHKEIDCYWNRIPARRKIVLKASCPGYDEDWLAIDIPTNKAGEVVGKYVVEKTLYLWPVTPQDQMLGTATVNASRILMVNKGDTIEYNASAFKMAQGSMLDNLIQALPGVNLDNNGRITVNGEFVSSLLINGRDFFNGNPKLALKNLPAYTVHKIQVYHKEDYFDQFKKNRTEEERRKDPLVMDVKLKREYAEGWLSNYEIGGGSTLDKTMKEKWMGRLFALRYTNHSSVSIYAGANNLSDDVTPGSKGEWHKPETMSGENKFYYGGVHFTLDPKDSEWKFSTGLDVKQNVRLYKSGGNSETYYSTGNIFNHYNSRSDDRNTSIDWKGDIKTNLNRVALWMNSSAYYKNGKGTSSNHNISLHENSTAGIDTLYRRTLLGNNDNTSWGGTIDMKGMTMLNNYSFINFSASSEYNRRKSHLFQSDHLIYPSNDTEDKTERRKFEQPSLNYTYKMGGSYDIDRFVRKENFKMGLYLSYNFEQHFNSGRQELTRNTDDWLAPSAATNEEWIIDTKNTYHTTRMERKNEIKTTLAVWAKDFSLDFSFNSTHHNRRVNDYRTTHRHKTTNDLTFTPEASLSFGHGSNKASLQATMRTGLPDLMHLIDVRDSSNPLSISEGNPALKKAYIYEVGANYSYDNREKMRNLRLKWNYSTTQHAVGMSRTYDRTTGVTTSKPLNIEGNWNTSGSFHYSRFLDKDKNFNIQNELTSGYGHSVDFASSTGESGLTRQHVNRIMVSDRFTGTWRHDNLTLNVKARFNWQHMESEQKLFTPFSYTSTDIGLSLTTPLVWDIDVSTDLMVYMKRGYNDRNMNTTEWVWNAQLTRSFGKSKEWLVKVIGFDILRQISNYHYSINAQGRSEAWYNSQPSYVTLHLLYRLDVKPSKKSLGKNK